MWWYNWYSYIKDISASTFKINLWGGTPGGVES